MYSYWLTLRQQRLLNLDFLIQNDIFPLRACPKYVYSSLKLILKGMLKAYRPGAIQFNLEKNRES